MDTGEIVGTLVGGVLGWGLTQLSTWLGTRQADKRVGKEALYFLLELHRLLAATDRLNRHLPKIVAAVRQYTTTAPPGLDELLDNWLREMAGPLIGRQLTALKAGYDTSLLKLAALDPVGAYRLRGLDELLQRVPELFEAMQSASVVHLGQQIPLTASVTSFFRQHIEAQDVTEALTLLRDVMLSLAKQLDQHTRRELAAELLREEKREQELPGKYANYMAKVHEAFPPPV